MLLLDLLLQLFSFLGLLFLERDHALFEVSSHLLHRLNLIMLLVELALSVLELCMLVPETIDLSFELIGFLLFHHLHVTSCDALDFREARVAESVSTEADIG